MSELFNKEDIFTIVNAEEARWYIGKKGYFASNLAELKKNINSDSHILSDILNDNASARFMYVGKYTDQVFELFLPADKVKEVKKEKKYRPFSLEEFLSKFSIGTKISFRRRDMTRSIYGLFEGYQTDKDESEAYHKIIICNLRYTLNDLFERYEYLDEHGEWQPFGVLEK